MNSVKNAIVYGAALALALAAPAATAQSQQPAAAPVPPGQLVDLGGYRLHLNQTGKGSPTVVLVAGAGDFSFDWSLVQPGIARFARVVSYDRAGLAWSDLGPTPRTMRQEVHELHELLRRAGCPGPYLLVGHSVGGLIVRLFAEQHPAEVAGLVLLDSTTDDPRLLYQGKPVRVRDGATGQAVPAVQTLQSSPPQPPTADDVKQAAFNREVFGAPNISPPFDKLPPPAQQLRLWALNNPKLSAATADFWAEELQAMYQRRQAHEFLLGTIPLVVVLPQRADPDGPPDGISAEEWQIIIAERRQQKAALAALSRNSQTVRAEKSGHHIQLDEPEVVVDAVYRLVQAAKKNTRSSPK